MLLFNYGHWVFWDTYNPDDGIYGSQKVTFDGPNRTILINKDVTEIDFQIDVYSNWKEWSLHRDNTKYLQAISSVGGDPLPGDQNLGITYFLENSWKIKPYAAEHRLTVNGNVYSRDGSDPFLPSDGEFKVTIQLTVSNLVDLAKSPLSTVESNRLKEIWQLDGLDVDNPLTVTSSGRTVDGIDQDIDGTDPVTVTRNP